MTPGERTVRLLLLLRDGCTKETAAEALGVSERAVKRYLRAIEDAGVPIEIDDDQEGAARCQRYYQVRI